MSRWRPWVFCPAALMSMTGSGWAATPPLPERMQPMRVFVAQDSRPGCAPCGEWLAAEGKIVPGTHVIFDRVLRSLGSRHIPVLIDSPGGSVSDAMAMGRAIRTRHLDVVVTRTDVSGCGTTPCRSAPASPVPAQPHGIGAVCASACALVLAAGEKRQAAPWTAVGIHQIIMSETRRRIERLFRVVSRQENGTRVVISRTLIGEKPLSTEQITGPPPDALYRSVSSYLAEMGIGAGLMPLMRATPPSGIHWLSATEERDTAMVTDFVDGEYVVSEAERNAKPSSVAATAASVDSIPEQAALVVAAVGIAKPRVLIGRVTWSFDPGPATDPRRAVLRATVTVPDAGATVAIRMIQPPDASAVAPVINLAVSSGPNALVRVVDQAIMPRARNADTKQSVPLTGTVLPNGDDAFQFCLSDDPDRAAANVAWIETTTWLDVPLMINHGAATLVVEHGLSGSALMQRALDAWASKPPTATAAPSAGSAPKS